MASLNPEFKRKYMSHSLSGYDSLPHGLLTLQKSRGEVGQLYEQCQTDRKTAPRQQTKPHKGRQH